MERVPKMDNNLLTQEGGNYLLMKVMGIFAVLGQVFGFLKTLTFHEFLSDVSLTVSILVGVLAARHYIKIDKRKKQENES